MSPRPERIHHASRSAASLMLLIGMLCLAGCSEAAGPSPGSASGSGSGNGGEASGQRSVLLICLDTVRADHLGFLGYTARDTTPAMDALAARSIVFDDVTAAACWTKPSVPSYMTGSFPATHGVYEGSSKAAQGMETDVLAEDAVTLAEAFRDAGYATAAFLRNGQLAPGFGLDQGFETYENGPYDASALADMALDWLDQRDPDKPFFLYVHVLDAHWPFHVPDEELLEFARPEDVELIRQGDWHALMDAVHDGERELLPEEEAGILAIYDACLRYTDDHLARLFDALADAGQLDDMVVSVVADHGEEFLEHGRYGHGHGLYENLTRVGWMLHAPGVEPGHRSQPVSLIDLHPSVLSAAGVPTQGELLAVDRITDPDRPAALFSEHKSPSHYEQALRQGRWKLVRSFRSTVPPKPTDALQTGTRWEAEFEVRDEGRFVVTQLKPRDEPPLDPLELRGILASGVADGALELAGIPLLMSAELDVYGLEEDASALAPGVPVKAVGDLVDGRLSVQRVKVYAAGEAEGFELRGPLTRFEATTAAGQAPGGTVWIGPVALALDEATSFKGVPTSPRMDREDVRRILDLGAVGSAADGYTVEYRLFDLSSDPGEQTPVETADAQGFEAASAELRSLSGTLDRMSAAAHGRNHWSERGAGMLDEGLLDELRALGYVR